MKQFRVMVEVLPKGEILDPEGEVLRQRLPAGAVECQKIRAGRLFEMSVLAVDESAVRAQVMQWMSDWLVNSVVQEGRIASIESV
jgi:phosphoribosylformylglycinamidine (FGAM) synthase PurS component